MRFSRTLDSKSQGWATLALSVMGGAMQSLRTIVVVLAGTLAIQGLGVTATAQTREPPAFVSGELIVGYKSENDRQIAMQGLVATKGDLRALGSEQVPNFKVEALSGSALKLRLGLPARIRTLTKTDPNAGRRFLEDLATKLKQADSRVKYVHPNWIIRLDPVPSPAPLRLQRLRDGVAPRAVPQAGAPNDEVFVLGAHWHYEAPPQGMNAVGAWALSKGDKSVVVAIVDSGILFAHPDIAKSGNVLPGYNFFTLDNKTKRNADATDPGDACPPDEPEASWHGTHVAGTVGAIGTNNGAAIAGVNWNVAIVPVRVLGACGGSIEGVADGVRWAAGLPVPGVPLNPHPAQVINMSLGGRSPCTIEANGYELDALNAARAAGSIVVVAAGNKAIDVKDYSPSGCPGVISVTAHDPSGRLTSYSNYGEVTIMAPGGDPRQQTEKGFPGEVWSVVKVRSDAPSGIPGVGALSGTSQAAPHVSGAIALALALHPDWRGKPDLIVEKLKASAAPLAQGACPKPCGVGQLDAVRLLQTPAASAEPGAREATPSVGGIGVDASQPQVAARGESDAGALDGAWLMSEGEGILRIEGSEWRHPDKGLATLSRGPEAGEYDVTYQQRQGIKCAYRVTKAADGRIITLEAADATQMLDYCPSGKLLRAE